MQQNQNDKIINKSNSYKILKQPLQLVKNNFKKGINILNNFTLLTIVSLFCFSIVSQIVLFSQDWKVNVNAQNLLSNSVSTVEGALNPTSIIEVNKLNTSFNDRQIKYLSNQSIEEISPNKDILTSYKESLKSQIKEKEAQKALLEQERLKQENEKKRIEEEARIARENEAKRLAQEKSVEAAKAKQEAINKQKQELKAAEPKQAANFSGDKYDLMRQAGIAEADFTYVDYIITKESGWNYKIWNTAGSGAFGLCQALPGSKMASAGSDYQTNPVTQLKWCASYAKSRYKGWAGAYSFWINNKWW